MGQEGQIRGRFKFTNLPPTSKLDRLSLSFDGGMRGRRGRFFKNFPKEPKAVRTVQKQCGNDFSKVHCLPKLDTFSFSFGQCTKCRKCRFLKTFPKRQIPRAILANPDQFFTRHHLMSQVFSTYMDHAS